ncbi:unnamed protein product [Durusdinium trenchii]|uniref:Ubiquitin-like domain-containing protein n=1 Tax=Durusdinium trenchii TaxID=1381693 RepID=A0ABP0P2Z8_9DINO
MGNSWSGSSGQVRAFPSKADFTERRSSSALLDKGFAALERDFELSQRAVGAGGFSPRGSDEEGIDEVESPQLSPQHATEGSMDLSLIWMDGSCFQLKASTTATCQDVISMLHRRGAISRGCPRLLFGKSLLEGSTCLKDVGVSSGSELQLVLSRPTLQLNASDNNLGLDGVEALIEGLPGPLLKASLMRAGLFGREGGQAVARLLRASPGLEFLDLSGNNGFGALSLCATGIDLKALASEIRTFYSLRYLVLADCNLEGALGGQELACLLSKAPNLKSLDLHSNNNLGSSGLLALSRALRQPTQIIELTVEDTGLEEVKGGQAVAALLHQMPLLKGLNLSNNLLLSIGLQALAESMPSLSISRLAARNLGLPISLSPEECDIFQCFLSKCPQLEFVDTEGHNFDGPELGCMNLLRPDVSEPEPMDLIQQIEGEGPLSALLKGHTLELSKLRSFCPNHSLQGAEVVKVLNMMRSLEHLSVNGSGLALEVLLESLRQSSLNALRFVDLGDCGLTSAAGRQVSELLQGLPQLRGLSLAKNGRLENGGVQSFGATLGAHSLSEIDLSCCSIAGEEGAEAIFNIFQQLPDLQSCSLSSNPGLGSEIAKLLEHILCRTRISSVSFASCGVSSGGLALKLEGQRCLHLTSLNMSGNTEIGPVGLQSFTSQLPNLNLSQVDLADCGLESGAGGNAIASLLTRCHCIYREP